MEYREKMAKEKGEHIKLKEYLILLRMKPSNEAIELLKDYESLLLDVHTNKNGSKTIGYGHDLLPGENYTRITEEQATKIMFDDCKKIGYEVKLQALKKGILLKILLYNFSQVNLLI